MRKVSFTEAFNNKYVPYHRQEFVYSGLEIPIIISDVDYNYSTMGIYTFNGIRLTTPDDFDQTYHDNILKLKQPLDASYIGQKLLVWYQPNDCYTVDFNAGSENTCRVTLGRNDGEPVTIIYEANPYVGDYALAETVDLNALNNPNNRGFMYITQTIDSAEIFRVNVSPDEFVANGFNYSVIILEVVDKYGNPVSNADYEFTDTLQYGSIQPYYSPDYEDYLTRKSAYITAGHTEDEWYANYGHYIGLNEMAGRQVFLYRAHRLKSDSLDEVTERIIVKDKVSGLGTEISIRLVIKSDYKLTN
jgi:hypothetical protein